jgi:hypothetical protein
MFETLRKAMEEQRLALQSGATGASLEQVLVFETNGSVKDFVEAVKATVGLAWLADEEVSDLAPDSDFFILDEQKNRTDRKLTARLYMVLANQTALEQLLTFWRLYASDKRRIEALKPWRATILRKCGGTGRRWRRSSSMGISRLTNHHLIGNSTCVPSWFPHRRTWTGR